MLITQTVSNKTLSLGRGVIKSVAYINCIFTSCSGTTFERCKLEGNTFKNNKYVTMKGCSHSDNKYDQDLGPITTNIKP